MSQTNFDDIMLRIEELIEMEIYVSWEIYRMTGIEVPASYYRGLIPPGELGLLVRELYSIRFEKMRLKKMSGFLVD